MRISLINLNLIAGDAIGACIIHQARLFRRRGDDVRIYVLHPPEQVPPEVEELTHVVTLQDLVDGSQGHFCLSDLYIYHYPGRHALMESIRSIDQGTVIFYYHNVTPPELWGSDADREALVQGMEGKSLVHYADLCIADSPYNKQDLVDQVGYDPERIYVLPLAVPLDRVKPGERDEELVQRYGLEGKRVLLFIGRMAGNKRIDLLVRALPLVKHRVPQAKLLLVGDDHGSPAYRQVVAEARALAAEQNVAQDVVWTGPQFPPDPYLRLADVYVTASLHEGFGVPLIEAMACGIPVVASRVSAMPWVVGDAGLLAEPGDAAGLADQVVRVLQDADLRETLVQRGLERAKEFSLESYEAKLAELVSKFVTHTLPPMADEPKGPPQDAPKRWAPSLARDELMLDVLSKEIEANSDIAIRGYVVKSQLPVVGPLVAWVRRNATSHLREPYLDPMIERQVAYNRRVAAWLEQADAALQAASAREAGLQARIDALELKIEELARRLVETDKVQD